MSLAQPCVCTIIIVDGARNVVSGRFWDRLWLRSVTVVEFFEISRKSGVNDYAKWGILLVYRELWAMIAVGILGRGRSLRVLTGI